MELYNAETLYVGIDPGLDGAVAAISNEAVVGIWDTPSLEIKSNAKTKSGKAKTRRVYVPSQMTKILKDLIDKYRVAVCLELVHSMPKQGVASQFSLGRGMGLWEGIVAALSIPIYQVAPTKWKKTMGLKGDDKNASIVQACQLFPEAAGYFTRKKDHGRAEALLLAVYLRQNNGQ